MISIIKKRTECQTELFRLTIERQSVKSNIPVQKLGVTEPESRDQG